MFISSWLTRLGLGRAEQRAWAMYDWANSAYFTVIVSAILPPFFATYYAAGMDSEQSTAWYAMLASVALLISALISPLLGTMADYAGAKKKFLGWFTLGGAISTAALFFVARGNWKTAALLTAISAISIGAALVFYEGLLPQVAAREEMDRVSAAGYALGYIGGGLLLLINVASIFKPGFFFMPDQETATRWSFVSVAVWWLVFSIPLFRRVTEPPPQAPPGRQSVIRICTASWQRLAGTFRQIRQYRDLFVFLVAFWFYNDGIGTIIKMATLYGQGIGIGLQHLVLALLITQFVAFPFSFLFGALAGSVGPKNGLYLALAVYTLIVLLGFLMHHVWHFYALAILVGTVQGGAQALSRSLFARMVPRTMAGEFFGFFSVSSKFATILGPALFAAVIYLTHTSRLAILSLAVFFIGGIAILSRVDVARGEARAREVDEGNISKPASR